MKKVILYGLPAIAVILVGAYAYLWAPDMPAAEAEAKYANDASQFITLPDGARIHYRDQGRWNGHPIVLVHGANASLHTWEPWVVLLGDQFRVITLDLQGHGLTGPIPSEDYTTGGMADLLDRFVEAIGLERFALGGSSMGGNIAWVYAIDHPAKLDALILVGSAGLQPPREGESAEEGSTPLFIKLLTSPLGRKLGANVSPRPLVRGGVEAMFVDQSLINDAMVDRYVDLNLREGNRAATLKRSANPWPDSADYQARLGEITTPTLVLHGLGDVLVPPAVGEALAARIPDATLILYESVGHIPMEEVAEQSAADLRTFMDNVLGPNGRLKPGA
ncbi:MAG: alpha/beta fold hydrolase [Alphaproteobacteria bacterium]